MSTRFILIKSTKVNRIIKEHRNNIDKEHKIILSETSLGLYYHWVNYLLAKITEFIYKQENRKLYMYFIKQFNLYNDAQNFLTEKSTKSNAIKSTQNYVLKKSINNSLCERAYQTTNYQLAHKIILS
jgi:hypothetical protein